MAPASSIPSVRDGGVKIVLAANQGAGGSGTSSTGYGTAIRGAIYRRDRLMGTLSKLPHPTSLGLTSSLGCGWGFRVDSRSGRNPRQEVHTLRSRSPSRDLLTGAERPFAWYAGPGPALFKRTPTGAPPPSPVWLRRRYRSPMFFAVVRLRLTGSQKSPISGDGVVVGVVLVAAFQTRQTLTLAVVRVREPTV